MGVELDVAMALDPEDLSVWGVIFGEFESGKSFNWEAMSWPDDGQ